MSEEPVKKVRNFVYVDVPLLYSIYSQIFEGITDKITEESIIKAITSNTEGIPLSPARSETQSADISRRVESLVLHDHMYSRLEEKISNSIINTSGIDENNITNVLSENSLIKVSGRAEIEDYEKLRTFITQFNRLTEVIVYAIKSSDKTFVERVLDLMEKLSNAENNNRKKQLQSELDKLTNTISEARKNNLFQDPIYLEKVALFAEIINATGYEVLITPFKGDVKYRGILDRTWLRMAPQLISSMYGGQSESPWSMVGIVTNIQGTYTTQGQSPVSSNPDNPMMLDAYRNMFRSSRFFERMFLESYGHTEIIVSPIAIYREFIIKR